MRILGLVMLVSLAATAQTVEVPQGSQVYLTLEGRGAQIYLCKNVEGGAKWTFVAPDADLYLNGLGVGTHGAGPVWNYSDGSALKGTVVTTVESPDPKAVPWLLLSAETLKPGKLGGVSYITRTQTIGGKVEGEVCNNAAVGTVLRKNYIATYTFYKQAGK